jgi:formate--tetrahydrofolate ligase
MAIISLAEGIDDLKARLDRILVGFDRDGGQVTAGKLNATGAMAALLHDARLPNLVQSSEGVPALVHGGPFGNIAHGCNSVVATRTAARLADYVVTEAGFGFDLGAEKFFDIKCRSAGLWPHAVVLVVTVRALRIHGCGSLERTGPLQDIVRGLEHLDHHVASVRTFGFEPVIAINVFSDDSEEELQTIEQGCHERALHYARTTAYRDGGPGAEALAATVLEMAGMTQPPVHYLYDLSQSPQQKICAVARRIYGAADIELSRTAKRDLEQVVALGYDQLPICIAKTHLSLSADPNRPGHTDGFVLPVEQVHIAAGAGYLLALTGDIVTMPGLPREPAAYGVNLNGSGEVTGIE